MRFLDANAGLGRPIQNYRIVNHEHFYVSEQVSCAEDTPALLGYMDACGIERAAVWHMAMVDVDPGYGNRLLDGALEGHEGRLVKSWAILPELTDRQFERGQFFTAMKVRNVRLLRAYPAQNRYLLCETSMGRQLMEISDRKIPLYLSTSDGPEPVYRVLREFPDLTVILCHIGCWSSSRFIYPLLDRYKNVFFETGDFQSCNGFEKLCRQFGSGRALFGTNFPSNNMGCAKHALLEAGISDREKTDIACGNLEALLERVCL